jgi:hypothetical protein
MCRNGREFAVEFARKDRDAESGRLRWSGGLDMREDVSL